jgi:DNA-binding NtrC family response regulator
MPNTIKPKVILLVDDDVMVLGIVAQILTSGGFTAIAASSAAQALTLLDAMPQLDLLLTDITMPLMNGIELAGAVREHRPALPVLLMTGHSDGNCADAGLAAIQKPFSRHELLAFVTNALAA